MVFHSFAFLNFFVLVYFFVFVISLISRGLTDSSVPNLINKTFLLAASYYFYAYWDIRFLSLIILSTVIAYFSGLLISKTDEKKQKKQFLFVSLLLNLTILSFFKYYNFFIGTLNVLTDNIGLSLPFLHIILPVGISFYIFQSMSYSLDIYFRAVKPTKSLLDIALFISFFPQLMAGPIVRSSHFLPQLRRYSSLTLQNLSDGFQVFLFGLLLKIVVADNIAPIIDPVFKDPSHFSSSAVWFAVLGYSVQIFCDFCGYSEMAIGLAMVFGFKIPQNFNAPYFALDVGDFWRRWHISLSTWFRDYLFVPLQLSSLIIFSKESRNTLYRASINFLIVMGLIGLWHGASWKYVLFGLYHGVGLTVNHALSTYRKFKEPNLINKIFSWASTFLFVLGGYVLFRAENMSLAIEIYEKMFLWDSKVNSESFQFNTIGYFFIGMMAIQFWQFKRNSENITFKPGSLAYSFYIFLLINLIYLFAQRNTANFIYFQF
jgi:alginate O-acetyltransferase complex protein AlgI